MDYPGDCREVGVLVESLGQRCKTVHCAPLPSEQCPIIYPPGSCCPVCGGSIRIVYSRKQIDRALYALKGRHLELVTLRGVLRALAGLVQLSHCRLAGFLTMETDLFVTVQSVGVESSSIVQSEACSREAEKIATLIGTQSHRVTSDLALSALTVANVVVPAGDSIGNGANSVTIGVAWLWIVMIGVSVFGTNYPHQ